MDPYKSVYGINFDVATELIDGPKKFGQIIRKVDKSASFPGRRMRSTFRSTTIRRSRPVIFCLKSIRPITRRPWNLPRRPLPTRMRISSKNNKISIEKPICSKEELIPSKNFKMLRMLSPRHRLNWPPPGRTCNSPTPRSRSRCKRSSAHILPWRWPSSSLRSLVCWQAKAWRRFEVCSPLRTGWTSLPTIWRSAAIKP
jgi:hypothetical protein